jgi:hypothetical protein
MKLEIVIQELLYQKNFITIPGFGSLVSQYQPARIVKSDHIKFIPPQKIIAFNPSITEHDDSLVTILCSDYKLPLELAQQEVAAFVNKTKEILQAKRSASMSGIGDFFVDNEGVIRLKPAKEINYLTDSFGLSSFHVHAIPKEDALKRAIQKRVEKSGDSIQKKAFKALFVGLPIIFALLLIPNILHLPQSASLVQLFRSTEVAVDVTEPRKPIPEAASHKFTVPEASNSVYDTPLAIQTPPPQSNEPSQAPTVESQTEQATQVAAIQETPAPAESNFYVIVASFTNELRAQEFAQELQQKSFDAGVVVRDNRIRVYISHALERADALVSLQNIRSTKEFKDAWLYADS